MDPPTFLFVMTVLLAILALGLGLVVGRIRRLREKNWLVTFGLSALLIGAGAAVGVATAFTLDNSEIPMDQVLTGFGVYGVIGGVIVVAVAAVVGRWSK